MAVLDLNVVRATISAVSATAQQQDKQPTNNIVKAHSGGDKQHTHTHISPNGCNLTGLDFFPSSTLSPSLLWRTSFSSSQLTSIYHKQSKKKIMPLCSTTSSPASLTLRL